MATDLSNNIDYNKYIDQSVDCAVKRTEEYSSIDKDEFKPKYKDVSIGDSYHSKMTLSENSSEKENK